MQGVLGTVRNEIAKLKGSVLETALLGKQAFVRPMQKMDAGYYAKIRFTLDPLSQAPLLARLKLIDSLFRVQIVSIDATEAAKPLQKKPAEAATSSGERRGNDQP